MNGDLEKLNKRANKAKADRTFVPDEYVQDKAEFEKLNSIVSFIRSNNIDLFLRVVDQKPYSDGVIIENRVYMTQVDLAWPGFVAVYENPYDKYGTLVGTSRFLPAGKHMYVPVDLVKEYKPGAVLYAILHRDTGDGIYNLVQDQTVKDKYGFEIVDSFTIRDGGFGR